jgi:hypothetical protein
MASVPLPRQQAEVLDPVVMLVAVEVMDHFVGAGNRASMSPPDNMMLVGVAPSVLFAGILDRGHLQNVGSVTQPALLG